MAEKRGYDMQKPADVFRLSMDTQGMKLGYVVGVLTNFDIVLKVVENGEAVVTLELHPKTAQQLIDSLGRALAVRAELLKGKAAK